MMLYQYFFNILFFYFWLKFNDFNNIYEIKIIAIHRKTKV